MYSFGSIHRSFFHLTSSTRVVYLHSRVSLCLPASARPSLFLFQCVNFALYMILLFAFFYSFVVRFFVLCFLEDLTFYCCACTFPSSSTGAIWNNDNDLNAAR